MNLTLLATLSCQIYSCVVSNNSIAKPCAKYVGGYGHAVRYY